MAFGTQAILNLTNRTTDKVDVSILFKNKMLNFLRLISHINKSNAS